jgi:hypothetical protein
MGAASETVGGYPLDFRRTSSSGQSFAIGGKSHELGFASEGPRGSPRGCVPNARNIAYVTGDIYFVSTLPFSR